MAQSGDFLFHDETVVTHGKISSERGHYFLPYFVQLSCKRVWLQNLLEKTESFVKTTDIGKNFTEYRFLCLLDLVNLFIDSPSFQTETANHDAQRQHKAEVQQLV